MLNSKKDATSCSALSVQGLKLVGLNNYWNTASLGQN